MIILSGNDACVVVAEGLSGTEESFAERMNAKARELGYEKYFQPDMRTYPITDDHYPLLAAGLRVIDVIDLDYDAHHTLADDVNRVSAASLKVVGDVAVALVR